MAEAPRTFWQFLKSNWHTFELEVFEDRIEFRIIDGKDAEPQVDTETLSSFISGHLQKKVSELMSFETMKEALVAAKYFAEQQKKKG